MRKYLNEELNRLSVKEFKTTKKIPLTIVLDNIRSMNNIGSVFRTADAFLIEKILLCGITATPPQNEIHKTALGATESVEWEYCSETLDALIKLKEKGYTLLAIEQAEKAFKLGEYKPKPEQKTAIVFGHEVRGVQQKVVDYCDGAIEIPQYGTKHSLNISVCAGIVIWEIARHLTGIEHK
ncbi:MAG: RNA methyltransferase [Bacteroidales bacterium]|nr:RNA methyltransferase [Bacteroidales bacterium]MBN2819143.1 RNA methyltransferase [Bacteroidales bacterium]